MIREHGVCILIIRFWSILCCLLSSVHLLPGKLTLDSRFQNRLKEFFPDFLFTDAKILELLDLIRVKLNIRG